MDLATIRIGEGVGDVRLGSSPETMRQLLGAPDSIEAGEESEAWYYETLSLLFEGDPRSRVLIWCDASDPLLRIGSHYLIGKGKKEVEAIAASAGLTNGEWTGDPASEETLVFRRERLIFRCFEGRLEEVSIGLHKAP